MRDSENIGLRPSVKTAWTVLGSYLGKRKTIEAEVENHEATRKIHLLGIGFVKSDLPSRYIRLSAQLSELPVVTFLTDSSPVHFIERSNSPRS